jgi:putative Holliday junction resolvase
MRSLGLDIGDKRTGVAMSDSEGLLAVPLTVIANQSEDTTIVDIIELVEQHRIERIVVGLPRSLSGNLGQQADKVTAFVEKLRNAVATLNEVKGKQPHLTRVDIQLWDERFSTVAAEKLMVRAGSKRNKRNEHRDALSAAFILQGFLDSLLATSQKRSNLNQCQS